MWVSIMELLRDSQEDSEDELDRLLLEVSNCYEKTDIAAAEEGESPNNKRAHVQSDPLTGESSHRTFQPFPAMAPSSHPKNAAPTLLGKKCFRSPCS